MAVAAGRTLGRGVLCSRDRADPRMRMMRRLALICLALAPAIPVSARFVAADPVVSVWYRGSPPGQPRQDDLAVIKALGFLNVTWPSVSTAGAADLRRMADTVGVGVQVRADPQPVTPASALRPHSTVDVAMRDLTAEEIPALVWRAVAHGARVVCFDPGPSDGTG